MVCYKPRCTDAAIARAVKLPFTFKHSASPLTSRNASKKACKRAQRIYDNRPFESIARSQTEAINCSQVCSRDGCYVVKCLNIRHRSASSLHCIVIRLTGTSE